MCIRDSTQLQHPRGIDLAASIMNWGLPKERVRIVDQGAYGGGFVSQEDLAAIYSASDVLLMATAGEGFGIPAVEAQACGLPVIVTDFSAQSELCFAGWKVSYVTDWDYFQMAAHAMPDVNAIIDALEHSYAVSKDPVERAELRAKAVEGAQEYDADRVYERFWRPWLASKEVVLPLNRQQRRRRRNLAPVMA
jgi:glycosyltransferase involved in cell wall biosynthesis